MPRYNKATLMPCQWVMFFLFAFRSFQGCFVVLRSFQGCTALVALVVAAPSARGAGEQQESSQHCCVVLRGFYGANSPMVLVLLYFSL